MKRWFYTSGLVLCSLLFINLIGCQKANKTPLREFSKIVFLSNRDAPRRQFDIFIMNRDGSNQKNLTTDLQSIRSISRPLLSPDEKKILFVAFEKDRTALQVIDIQNESVLDLADVGFDVPQASFSPNGDRILFVKKVNSRKQVYIINTDGSGEQNLSNNNRDEFNPTFSPEGSKIAFVSNRNGQNSIRIMNLDGSNKKLVKGIEGNDSHPRFSPDGKKIVFFSYRNGSNNIYLAHIRRNSIKVIYESKANNINPQFSPDGAKILFLSNQRSMKYRDICIIDGTGKHFKNLTSGLNYINQHPQFTPDGKSIIFDSVKFNDSEIYKVDIDGKNLKNLTNHPKWDQSPGI